MKWAILIGIALVIGCRLVGNVLARRFPRLEEGILAGTVILSHFIFAVILGFVTTLALERPSPFRIAAAVLSGFFAVFEFAKAVGMLYVFVARREELSH
jgi:hypothetical protein